MFANKIIIRTTWIHGSRRPVTIALAFLTIMFLLSTSGAYAQGSIRAWGMAGGLTAGARGLDAVEFNPANLALSPGTNIGLVGVAVDVNNNALSLNRYNEITGAYLDEADKNQILSDIPESGLRLGANVRASALGVQVGNMAITFEAWGAGQGNLDRDYFDLVLFGNELDKTIDFSDTHGEGYALATTALSYGRQVYETDDYTLYGGMNVRYFQGFYEMHVEEAFGQMTTTMEEISGEALVSTLFAEGGSGAGLDLGMAMQIPDSWTFGLAFDNFYSNINWNTDVEAREFSLDASDINITNDDLDESIADADTVFYGGEYSTSLPRVMRLGAANRFGKFNLAADYVQGFSTRPTSSTTPQLILGAEWDLCSYFVPRAGMSLGGLAGRSLAGGFGLGLGPWKLDMAAMTRGGLTGGGTKGAGFAMGTSLKF
ncbi:MAG: hypothetical protein KOO60_05225 [Gemmatimonadales bacterium]|nr:hypothetical protein [Gemmatimonadales bacterium]